MRLHNSLLGEESHRAMLQLKDWENWLLTLIMKWNCNPVAARLFKKQKMSSQCMSRLWDLSAWTESHRDECKSRSQSTVKHWYSSLLALHICNQSNSYAGKCEWTTGNKKRLGNKMFVTDKTVGYMTDKARDHRAGGLMIKVRFKTSLKNKKTLNLINFLGLSVFGALTNSNRCFTSLLQKQIHVPSEEASDIYWI